MSENSLTFPDHFRCISNGTFICIHTKIYYVEPEIPKNVTNEICKFDAISASNSTMVGENFKNIDPEIPINAMKTHEICKLDAIAT